ncbi:hypothetical protein [Defluviimonas salinarum]|uniref:hypothetical protein n=1 Tax=Defluviimonas salinarum TaxID=2992147 RepID=UPI00222F7214|nr:hypothetical protein [Defluviimonas salinarum]
MLARLERSKQPGEPEAAGAALEILARHVERRLWRVPGPGAFGHQDGFGSCLMQRIGHSVTRWHCHISLRFHPYPMMVASFPSFSGHPRIIHSGNKGIITRMGNKSK